MQAEDKRNTNEAGLRPWALGTNGDQWHRKGGGTPSVMQMCLKLGDQILEMRGSLPQAALPSPTALCELTILTLLGEVFIGLQTDENGKLWMNRACPWWEVWEFRKAGMRTGKAGGTRTCLCSFRIEDLGFNVHFRSPFGKFGIQGIKKTKQNKGLCVWHTVIPDLSYKSVENNSLKIPNKSSIYMKKGLGIPVYNKRGNGCTLSP